MSHEQPRPTVSGNERINALSDGVFAIVITLLVLEIKVPEIPAGLPYAETARQLAEALQAMSAKFLGHIVSFAVLGIYWVGHHNQMLHIRRHDRAFLWLTILFLLCIASMPFPTGLMIHYNDQQLPVLIYAAALIVTGLSLDLMWWYATRNHHLVKPDLDRMFIRTVHQRILTAPVFYLAAAAASFFSVRLAEVIFALTAAYYILPSIGKLHLFDRHHHQNVHQD